MCVKSNVFAVTDSTLHIQLENNLFLWYNYHFYIFKWNWTDFSIWYQERFELMAEYLEISTIFLNCNVHYSHNGHYNKSLILLYIH